MKFFIIQIFVLFGLSLAQNSFAQKSKDRWKQKEYSTRGLFNWRYGRFCQQISKPKNKMESNAGKRTTRPFLWKVRCNINPCCHSQGQNCVSSVPNRFLINIGNVRLVKKCILKFTDRQRYELKSSEPSETEDDVLEIGSIPSILLFSLVQNPSLDSASVPAKLRKTIYFDGVRGSIQLGPKCSIPLNSDSKTLVVVDSSGRSILDMASFEGVSSNHAQIASKNDQIQSNLSAQFFSFAEAAVNTCL